jgi:UDPglucose 6-dehydrogenase
MVENPEEAIEGAHAVAILTEWDEFKNYNWEALFEKMQKPAFIFDGRNILNPEKMKAIGFIYQGIGA